MALSTPREAAGPARAPEPGGAAATAAPGGGRGRPRPRPAAAAERPGARRRRGDPAALAVDLLARQAETILQGTVTQLLKKEYGKSSDLTAVWNKTMEDLKCCGLMNYTDFNDSYYFEKHNEYPPFCCGNVAVCSADSAKAENMPGCFPQLLSEIRKNAGVVGGVAAGICVLEVAAMAVAMYLYCRLDEK